MIRLGNGYEFQFQCASGALNFDGRGYLWEYPLRWCGIIDPHKVTVVAKTVTLSPRKGNLSWWHPWTCVRLLPRGTVNCVGLTNPGIRHWCEVSYPTARSMGYTIAASVEAPNWQTARELGYWLKEMPLPFVELNASCPNVPGHGDTICEIARALRRICDCPIILKVSFGQTLDVDFLKQINAQDAIDAIHAINAVPWNDVFGPVLVSPVEKHTGGKGGVSGSYIRTLALQAVRTIKKYAPTKPVVGGGGIYSPADLQDMREAGADAFSLGTVYLKHPWRVNRILAS